MRRGSLYRAEVHVTVTNPTPNPNSISYPYPNPNPNPNVRNRRNVCRRYLMYTCGDDDNSFTYHYHANSDCSDDVTAECKAGSHEASSSSSSTPYSWSGCKVTYTLDTCTPNNHPARSSSGLGSMAYAITGSCDPLPPPSPPLPPAPLEVCLYQTTDCSDTPICGGVPGGRNVCNEHLKYTCGDGDNSLSYYYHANSDCSDDVTAECNLASHDASYLSSTPQLWSGCKMTYKLDNTCTLSNHLSTYGVAYAVTGVCDLLPPPPPLALGANNRWAKEVTLVLKVGGTVEEYEAKAGSVKTSLRQELRCFLPACELTVTVTAGSVILTVVATDTAGGASQVESAAVALQAKRLDVMSSMLGITIEEAPSAPSAIDVQVQVARLAPSPPPPSGADQRAATEKKRLVVGLAGGAASIVAAFALLYVLMRRVWGLPRPPRISQSHMPVEGRPLPLPPPKLPLAVEAVALGEGEAPPAYGVAVARGMAV